MIRDAEDGRHLAAANIRRIESLRSRDKSGDMIVEGIKVRFGQKKMEVNKNDGDRFQGEDISFVSNSPR